MSHADLFLFQFLLASAGCLAAGLIVWALTVALRRLPGFQLQRSTWLLAQATVVAAFLVILLPHSERLRIVPPIELADAIEATTKASAKTSIEARETAAPSATQTEAVKRSWLAYGAQAWLLVYLMGLVCAALKLMHGQRILTSLAGAGWQIDAPDSHAGLAGTSERAPGLKVIEVDAPVSPMLFGLFRPRLLLPRQLRSFEPVQQQMIVEHELTHLRRRDLHWMSAGLLLQTLLWFNPFMRLLHERLCWAQELGCDRDVLASRSPMQRKAYAAALVAQLKMQRRPVHATLAFGGVSASTVAERIALIREPVLAARSRLARVAALAGLAAIFIGSLAFQPALAWRGNAASASAALQAFSCTEMIGAATGERLVHEGQCDERVTPASTFNIAVSLMGYDKGILIDQYTPALPFKEGYADWNPAWRTATDPTSWLRESVVWYAQQVVAAVGEPQFQRYVQQFNYGNQDVSGDPGKDNALTMSWISSSLKISPVEQVAFLRKIVNRQLPLSAKAYDMTSRIMPPQSLPNGWVVRGKTGTATPVLANGNDDKTRQYGWYVGWASKGQRTVVFARLVLAERPHDGAAGWGTRDAFLRGLPQRLGAL
ncbi:MAG: class D beta-lactamase [Bdellovibrionales bacterium]|nr:class D beta-lactamase [Massilia sp.]